VSWQGTNGQIQIGPVTAYMWNDSNTVTAIQNYPKFNPADPAVTSLGIQSGLASSNGNGLAVLSTSYGYVGSAVGNSLVLDAGGIGNSNPLTWETLTATGGIVGSTSPFPSVSTNFNAVFLCNIIVPTAGTHTINVQNKHQVLVGIGGLFGGTPFASAPFYSTGSNIPPAGQTMTAYSGFPLLPWFPYNNISYPEPVTSISVNFPSAGIYPMEVDYDYWYHSGRTMCLSFDNATTSFGGNSVPTNYPVTTSVVTPPPASTPSGVLTITPAGGVTNFQFTGSPITLTVNISGVTYTSKSYCPVLEGTSGNLLLYNSASSSTYTFQTYNGNSVNKTAYAPVGFQLSSADNNAYQGLFGVSYNGSDFSLNYNGTTANSTSASRVLSTSLIVTADDVAWFNNSNNSFDLFVPAGSTGGNTFNFEVDYMNNPSVASISPTTITANGNSYTLVISLSKAFSPQQQGAFGTGNTVNCSCSITGATSTGSPSPNLDSGGWLTGWNVPFTAPLATSNQTLTVSLTVSGTLTYLSGDTFVTNTITYISGNVGTITANGSTYLPPSAQSFSVSPSGPTYPYTTTSVTATATVFTVATNDSVTCIFKYQPVGASGSGTIGTGSQTSSIPATIGSTAGYLQTFTFTFNPNSFLGDPAGNYLGFTATDNVSGLTCSYTSTTVYTVTHP
jgi:hypothetical protein